MATGGLTRLSRTERWTKNRKVKCEDFMGWITSVAHG